MIAITNAEGERLRVLPIAQRSESFRLGYHPKFGFVSDETLRRRLERRKRAGFHSTSEDFSFSFVLRPTGTDEQSFTVENLKNCSLQSKGSTTRIETPRGLYSIGPLDLSTQTLPAPRISKKERVALSGMLLFLLVLMLGWFNQQTRQEEQVAVTEEIEVKIVPIKEAVRITVPKDETLPPEIKQDRVAKRAIQQNLGFLGILGKKNLRKVLGGAPTQLQDASPGAGPGGKEGSGGELLAGLGAGLKRTTVGNTGVAGLGGIGTKGAGGGLGGYGTTSVGSGEGKSLSSVALSNDLLLDGGLDRSVVQATIAKYLSQVRACYEQGLQKNAALVGQVLMNFEINGGGDLNFAKVDRSSLGDREVENCISNRMMTWKFPSPKGGVNVKVSYPFMLRPVKT